LKRVILLGAGASLAEGVNQGLWDKIKYHEKWSLNSIFNLMPYLPDKEVWVDVSFFDKNMDNLTNLRNKGVDLIAKKFTHRKKYLAIANQDDLVQYDTTREREKYWGKFAIEKKLIYYGRVGLCGTFALSLAIAMGYDEIYLCGFDFGNSTVNDLITHIYTKEDLKKFDICCTGAFRPKVYRLPGDTVRAEVEDYDVFLKEKDIKIWNVSVNSNIYQFTRIPYDTFFNLIGN